MPNIILPQRYRRQLGTKQVRFRMSGERDSVSAKQRHAFPFSRWPQFYLALVQRPVLLSVWIIRAYSSVQNTQLQLAVYPFQFFSIKPSEMQSPRRESGHVGRWARVPSVRLLCVGMYGTVAGRTAGGERNEEEEERRNGGLPAGAAHAVDDGVLIARHMHTTW